MKSEEALEQIAYIKEVLEKSRLKVIEGYPAFLLGGVLWFVSSILNLFTRITPWTDRLWPVFGVASVIASWAVIKYHKWPLLNIKLLAQLGKQCITVLLSSVPVVVLLFLLGAGWVVKAYIPFQLGVAYIVAGIFMGRDLKIIGLGLVATSMLSFLLPYPFQDIWLAAVGGGGLILTGMIFKNQVKKSG